MKECIRTFIAIELSLEIQQSISNVVEELKKVDCHIKWVMPENFHITLKFLGDISLKQIDTVQEILKISCVDLKRFSINLTEVNVFPSWKNPRVLWVGVEDKRKNFYNLFEIIENKLNPLGFKKEEKEFHPHITIGRIKSSKNISLLSQTIPDINFKNDLRQAVTHITLFKSVLTSSAPVYTLINKIYLKN